MAAKVEPSGGAAGRKRKRAADGLADLHDDMLERVLARLPPAAFFRLRAVSRRWRAAAASATFRAACATVPARDPWFFMLSDDKDRSGQGDDHHPLPAAAVFDSGARAWARWRGAPPGPVPVASAAGLVLYRDAATGDLTVANPLTGATRALPPPPAATATGAGALQAVAMYASSSSPRCYRVTLFLGGDLSDGLSMACFDSSTNRWDDALVPLTRQPKDEASCSPEEHGAATEDYDDAVYFLSKSGDVVAPTMHRNASRQYASAVTRRPGDGDAVLVHFLSESGTVVACDVARRAFAELPRVLPAFHEYSVDVVACTGGAAYVVVLSELLGAASLRVWEFAGAGGGEWEQVAAMPPAMSQPFFGAKADVNCVGHGDKIMVCVTGEEGASGCFMCDVKTNRWEELPPCIGDNDGEVTDFVAAVSFEPRMEADV